MTQVRYVSEPSTYLVQAPGDDGDSAGAAQLLLGARLHVDPDGVQQGFLPARTVPDAEGNSRQGFVEAARTSLTQQLKVFYFDVGQGDACLVEAEGAVVIVDGGPNSGFVDLLEERLAGLRRAEVDLGNPPPARLRVDAVVVTHFDVDHYRGLISLLEHPEFEFGRVYHNGLPRYADGAGKDLDLGDVVNHQDGTRSISTDLRGLDTARALLASGDLLTAAGNDNVCAQFLRAAVEAADAQRLDALEMLVRRDPAGAAPVLPDLGPDLQFEVLGPLTTETEGSVRLRAFPDPHDVTQTNPNPAPSESHTVNGNSIVLRLRYGQRQFLFGGDLNQPAQAYLRERYGAGVFEADVNKACHHGSSDFAIEFLEDVAPMATVFSSGDSGSYDHPLPDAIGAAARHSRGRFPLVFSTELAREVGKEVLLGHINARSNGDVIVMAQKKEKPSVRKTWHAFALPFAGPFG